MKSLKAVSIYFSIFVLLSISISSCSDDTVTNIPDTRQPFEIRAWDYSDNHYFLDSVYKESFEDYYNNVTISLRTDSFSVDDLSFEVWVQTEVATTNYRYAGLHIDLHPSNGNYNETLKSVPNPQQGLRTFGLARKLSQGEYVLNKYAGYVSFKMSIPENHFAGVAYKRFRTGEQFGTISTDSGSLATDTLVLKMVKVQNLIPQNILAWNLKLRNIYQLPKKDVRQTGFELYLSYYSNNIYSPYLPGIATVLLAITGLDKYTFGTTGLPDNKFDFLPYRTINIDNGWIIYPSLKPFLTNLQNFHELDPKYWYPEIYSELKQNSQTVPNSERYVMHGFLP